MAQIELREIWAVDPSYFEDVVRTHLNAIVFGLASLVINDRYELAGFGSTFLPWSVRMCRSSSSCAWFAHFASVRSSLNCVQCIFGTQRVHRVHLARSRFLTNQTEKRNRGQLVGLLMRPDRSDPWDRQSTRTGERPGPEKMNVVASSPLQRCVPKNAIRRNSACGNSCDAGRL